MRKRSRSTGEQASEKNLQAKEESQQGKKPDAEMKNQQIRKIMKVKEIDEGHEVVKNIQKAKQLSKFTKILAHKEAPSLPQNKSQDENFDNNEGKPELREETMQKQQVVKIAETNQPPKNQKTTDSLLKQYGIFTMGNYKTMDLFKNSSLPKKNLFTQPELTKKTQSQFSDCQRDFLKVLSSSSNSQSIFFKKQDSSAQKISSNDDEEELESEQKEVEANPALSTGNYKYEKSSDINTHFKSEVVQLTKSANQKIQNVQVLVQSTKKQSIQFQWITIYLSATKLPILSGYIVKGKTLIKSSEKTENAVILSVMIRKDQTSLLTPLKLQFKEKDIADRFIKEVNSLVQ